METLCMVIFNLQIWGVTCRHSHNGQNFSSEMRSWVSDPVSQCANERNLTTQQGYSRLWASRPHSHNRWVWCDFLGGWATWSSPCTIFLPQKMMPSSIGGLQIGVLCQVGMMFSSARKGILSGIIANLFHHFHTKEVLTLYRDWVWKTQTSVRLDSIPALSPGGLFPSPSVSTTLNLKSGILFAATVKAHRLAPKPSQFFAPLHSVTIEQ